MVADGVFVIGGPSRIDRDETSVVFPGCDGVFAVGADEALCSDTGGVGGGGCCDGWSGPDTLGVGGTDMLGVGGTDTGVGTRTVGKLGKKREATPDGGGTLVEVNGDMEVLPSSSLPRVRFRLYNPANGEASGIKYLGSAPCFGVEGGCGGSAGAKEGMRLGR